MLQTYTRSNNGTAVASSTPINFLLNKIKRSCSVQHQEGSPSIVLHGAGTYKIDLTVFLQHLLQKLRLLMFRCCLIM